MAAGMISVAIFAASLWLIFAEKINRMIVAMLGAAAMVFAGLILGFYTQEQIFDTVDLHTLGLLLGMMILVALLEPTGFFEYLAVVVGKLSQGRPVRLLILLGIVTTVMSMFLDNVTTVVLIAPVTILICEILDLNPRPYLLSEALLSDAGGVATLVGDPPNILIGSAAGFSFTDFLVHSLPVVLVTWLASLWLLQRMFRNELTRENYDPDAVMQLQPEEAFKDRKTAIKVLIVVGLAILFFLLGEIIHIEPALVALIAAALAMAWARPDVRATLHRVEWDVLIFFAALFVMVGGMEGAGVLTGLANLIVSILDLPVVILGLLLLWFVALLSAVVDNIPITIAMIPVIQELGRHGIDVRSLWWALAFGAGFGGMGTIIGATANVIVVSLSERTRYPITPVIWSKRGLPVMLLACTVSSILFVIVTYTIGW